MTEYSRALEQIAEIHEHLAKTEVYRGWRSLPVASSGLVGLAAAGWQASSARPIDAESFTIYWLAIGVVALVIGCSEIVWHYGSRATPGERRRSLQVIGQFVPALLAGAIITGAVLRLERRLRAAAAGPLGAALRRRRLRRPPVRAARERLGGVVLLDRGARSALARVGDGRPVALERRRNVRRRATFRGCGALLERRTAGSSTNACAWRRDGRKSWPRSVRRSSGRQQPDDSRTRAWTACCTRRRGSAS